jgi:hypothetical protein
MYLTIALILATLSVAKTYDLNEIQNIMKIITNKNIAVGDVNNGVISSVVQPLAAIPYMGTGYYKYQLFSDSKCSNQALSSNVILNACTKSYTNAQNSKLDIVAYTKSSAFTNGDYITFSTVTYSDSGCTAPIQTINSDTSSSGCTQGRIYSTSNVSYIVGSLATSYKISLVPTIIDPTTDRALITT